MATPAQKQLLLWIIKDISKHSGHTWTSTCSTLLLPKEPHCCHQPCVVYPLWILSHCYCFCYTFSITSCCFLPIKLKKKERKKKGFLSQKRANLLCMKTALSKAGSQKLTKTMNLPNLNNNNILAQPFNYRSHCHMNLDGLLLSYTPISTHVIKGGRERSPPGYTGRKYIVNNIKTSSSLSSPLGSFLTCLWCKTWKQF